MSKSHTRIIPAARSLYSASGFELLQRAGEWKNQSSASQQKFNSFGFRSNSNKGNVPFETKLELADTLALTENHGSFTLQPGEAESVEDQAIMPDPRLKSNIPKTEKPYVTPALRLG